MVKSCFDFFLDDVNYFHLGVGADHHAETAVYWLKQSADQGHPKAQYNLAISHLRGFNTGLQPGYDIIKFVFFLC
jgi:TPR repeat protein